MNEINNIKAAIFDFGGTLDTDGIHWSERFWECYQKFNIPINKEQYEKAYRNAEPNVEQIISKNDSFKKTLNTQIYFQFKFLFDNKLLEKKQYEKFITEITNDCYNYVDGKISNLKNLLKYLSGNYSLALVSNFYGNINAVLKEFGINKYFDSVIDSSVVGINKPNPEIFRFAINELNVEPENCVIIGDSYSRDIQPAKLLGCSTIWLDGKSWSRPTDTKDADFIINSVMEIEELLSN